MHTFYCIHLQFCGLLKNGYLRNWLHKTQINNEMRIPHNCYHFFFLHSCLNEQKNTFDLDLIYTLPFDEGKHPFTWSHTLSIQLHFFWQPSPYHGKPHFCSQSLHDIPLCKLHTYWFVINDSFKRRINVLINWLECLKARVIFAFFSFKS